MKTSDIKTYALIGTGAALVVGLAYWAYQQFASNEEASSGGGTLSSGDQSTTLGPAAGGEVGGASSIFGNPTFSPPFNPSTPLINGPGPQGPMSGPIPSPGA